MATSKEQDDLLDMSMDDVSDPSPKKRDNLQNYFVSPESQYEVSVGGVVVSGAGESKSFDAALRLYDKCIKQHNVEVSITHILNGNRIKILCTRAVKHNARPVNPIGISFEEDTE